MSKRANIRDTRRATETLVAQNRAAHLREQGLIDAGAGPREAQQFDQAALKARRRAAEAEYRGTIGPHMSLGFGLIMAVLTVLIWAAGAPIVGFIIGLVAFASLLIWVLSTGIDALFGLLDRRSASR